MRVGLVISGSLDTVTGGYIYDRKLVEHIQRRGHSVSVVQLPCYNYPSRLGSSFRTSLADKLLHLPIDILLQDELDHPVLFLINRRLKTHLGCPIVSIVHHLRCCEARPSWQNRLYRQVEGRYLKSVDGFIFNSQTTRRTVEDLIGEGHPGVVAYPCGNQPASSITEAELQKKAKQVGPLRVIFIGNVVRRKGLHVLLEALSRMSEDACKLSIVGDLSMDRPYVKAIRRQIKKNRLNGRVVMLGHVSDADLADRLRENHVLAVPSSYEGFGMVYLEGMGFGLPAIGTISGGAVEIIAHGRNGFLIQTSDSGALAGYLSELSQDRRRLLEMSLNARQSYELHPTWENTGEEALAFLQNLVSDYKEGLP